MRIGVDLDDVLTNTTSQLIEYYNNKYKKKLKFEDFTEYGYFIALGMDREEAINEFFEFYKTDYFKNISPSSDSQLILDKLSKNNELFLVTSRHTEIKDDSKLWVNKYFPEIFDEFYFTNSFALDKSKAMKKSDFVKDMNLDIFIEDAHHYAMDVLPFTKKVFMFNKPWNLSKEVPEKVIRVEDWIDLESKIDE